MAKTLVFLGSFSPQEEEEEEEEKTEEETERF